MSRWKALIVAVALSWSIVAHAADGPNTMNGKQLKQATEGYPVKKDPTLWDKTVTATKDFWSGVGNFVTGKSNTKKSTPITSNSSHKPKSIY